jgi:hypothetical protein
MDGKTPFPFVIRHCHGIPIPVTIGCDSKAALTLCKDRKEGQRV